MRRRTALTFAASAGLVLAGGVAVAAIPGADGVIHGCYVTKSGALRVTDDGQCRNGETALSWSQTGPKGEPGQPGQPGPPGEQGPPGPAGAGNEIWFESRAAEVIIPGSPPGPVTWHVIADVDVPAGSYHLNGATTIDFGGTNLPDNEGRCELRAGGSQVAPESKFVVPGGMTTPMSVVDVLTVSAPTTIEMRCFAFHAIGVLNTTLTATKVAAVHS